jgi:hypothetical protein
MDQIKTHTGKIARLPRNLRDALNHRLENGEPARVILPWLNALPPVLAVLAAQFRACPINQQNLSNWRRGGYQAWLKQQEHRHLVREVAQDAQELAADPAGRTVANNLSTVLVAELALSTRKARAELTSPVAQAAHLRQCLQTLSHVRREDHRAGRLAIEQERQVLARSKRNDDKDLHNKTAPANRQLLRSILADFYASPGVKSDQGESTQIKVNQDQNSSCHSGDFVV